MLKVLATKNVSAETFLQELNSIKGKLFDLDVNMIFFDPRQQISVSVRI